MRALWAVDHALRSASKRMKNRVGLTGPQRLAVRIVGRFPNATAGEITKVLHVHPSTLTGILARLERWDSYDAGPILPMAAVLVSPLR